MPNADAPVDAKVDKAETEVKSESKDAPKEVPKPDQPRLPKPDRAALDASIAELQEAADVQQARIETLKRAIESRREKRKNITSGSQETRARIGELNAAFSTHMVRPVPPRDATVVPRLSRAPDPPISATPAALQAFALRNRRPEPIARASPAPPSAATMRSTSPRSPASLEIAASALSASRPATPPRSPHDASAAFGRGKATPLGDTRRARAGSIARARSAKFSPIVGVDSSNLTPSRRRPPDHSFDHVAHPPDLFVSLDLAGGAQRHPQGAHRARRRSRAREGTDARHEAEASLSHRRSRRPRDRPHGGYPRAHLDASLRGEEDGGGHQGPLQVARDGEGVRRDAVEDQRRGRVPQGDYRAPSRERRRDQRRQGGAAAHPRRARRDAFQG